MIEEASREQHQREEEEEEKKKKKTNEAPSSSGPEKEEPEEDEEDYSALEEVTKELSLNARPAWFDPNVFEKDDFNPDVYIDEMSPFVTPEDLATEVEKYADELQNKFCCLLYTSPSPRDPL